MRRIFIGITGNANTRGKMTESEVKSGRSESGGIGERGRQTQNEMSTSVITTFVEVMRKSSMLVVFANSTGSISETTKSL